MTIDVSFLKHLDRMALIVNKRITSSFMGERASLAGGSGLVLKDYVQYVPGDDFRRIDWKVQLRLICFGVVVSARMKPQPSLISFEQAQENLPLGVVLFQFPSDLF